MSEYHFGLTRIAVSQRTATRLDRIARKHGANYTGPIKLPGNDVCGWFSCPNRGQPFDAATASAVLADVAEAGITYPPEPRR